MSNRKYRRGRSKNPPFASSHRAFFMGQKLIACDNYHWPFLQGSLWAKTFLQCVDINQSWSKRCEPASVHVQPKSRFGGETWRWMTNATFTESDTSGMLFPAAHWLGLFYGETAMIDTGSLQLSTQRSQSGRASVPLRNAKGEKKKAELTSFSILGLFWCIDLLHHKDKRCFPLSRLVSAIRFAKRVA